MWPLADNNGGRKRFYDALNYSLMTPVYTSIAVSARALYTPQLAVSIRQQTAGANAVER